MQSSGGMGVVSSRKMTRAGGLDGTLGFLVLLSACPPCPQGEADKCKVLRWGWAGLVISYHSVLRARAGWGAF